MKNLFKTILSISLLLCCFSLLIFSPSKANALIIESKTTDTVPSRNYTVVIDAGHGGSDPGSIGYKTKGHEAELNLKLSNLLKEKLEKAGINEGDSVRMYDLEFDFVY